MYTLEYRKLGFRHVYASVHDIVHDSQKVETSQMPVNRRINKMGHIHTMRHLALGREGESVTCYDMDEP